MKKFRTIYHEPLDQDDLKIFKLKQGIKWKKMEEAREKPDFVFLNYFDEVKNEVRKVW